jgi:hypothetical protein
VFVIRILAIVALVVAWHFLFDFTWWQSLFVGWISGMIVIGFFHAELDLRAIKKHFGIDSNEW